MKKSFSDKMEQRLSRYAIPNITFYLVALYAIGYVFQLFKPEAISFLTLEPYYILHGQVWRLFSWLMIPPEYNLFFALLMMYFYCSIGHSLEQVWGTYRMNVYIFSGLLFTLLGSFGLYAVFGTASVGSGFLFSTSYINMSLFLAYAATFPDMQVLLFFIIPIRVKYLGIIYAILLIVSCIQGGPIIWVVIGSSLLNFLVFFLTSRKKVRLSPEQLRARIKYKRAAAQSAAMYGGQAKNTASTNTTRSSQMQPKITKHKCAVCGRTNESHPDLEFRFCSKCNGGYEYCQDHLFTHEHVK